MKIVLGDNKNDIFSAFREIFKFKFFKFIDGHIEDIASTH